MLAIGGSRIYIDAAVTELYSQTGSLRTYLEEEADLGAEACRKLRNAILTGVISEDIIASVRAMVLGCESSLWMLLRATRSNAHILDVLPTMWTTTVAFFDQAAAASPAAVIDVTHEIIVDGVREEKLAERAR
eukprot:553258-Pleurochrysis_carterae.AAC.1